MSVVDYGENEMRLVESGVAAVAAVFRHGSEREKASVLLCMERYLDPYYETFAKYPDVDEVQGVAAQRVQT